jgi:hypothetical protein
MASPVVPPTVRKRRGVALVAALAVVALATGLLVGAFASARALARANASARSAHRAESGARRAMAEVVMGWDGALDSLAVGASVERVIPSPPADAGPRLSRLCRVQRLSRSLFLVAVDVRVGEGSSSMARRRYRLLLQRDSLADSGSAPRAPRPISRWSIAEWY